MPELISILPADLLADEQNPRLAQPNAGQRETLRCLATYQGRKLQVLANDILSYGLDPSELTIVMPFEDDQSRYVVLDGNRRLTALRALENPEFLVDAVAPGVLTAIRRLSKKYQQVGIESIPCVVVKDRDEARHWIELRHTGEREGAGPVLWGSDESARFRARTDGLEVHTQALNFLARRGDITPEFRRHVPAASYRRLLQTPEVREKVGIEFRDNKLMVLGNEDDSAKALLYIAKDLESGNTKTEHIYTREDRLRYAANLPDDVVVIPTRKSGQGVPADTETTHTPSKTPVRPPRARDRLIPRDCALNVADTRLKEIERELRRLSLEDHTNAVSVLFRVFMELGADDYIQRVGLPISTDLPLGTKVLKVTGDLMARKKLTAQQAKPVRRACQKDSYLGPSITLMHQYIHNQHMFPAPSDLRASWNSLQPWFIAVCAR